MFKDIDFKKYIFLIAMFGVIYAITIVYNTVDWDLWARMAVGQLFFENHFSMPLHDPFSYTLQKPIWVDHEWGTGVIAYFLGHNFGDAGMLTLKFMVILLTFFFVFKTNELRSIDGNRYRLLYYFIFLLGVLPAYQNVFRSQVFTYLMFALWIYLLDLVRNGNNKLIWVFPVAMMFWANVHGGFLAGLGITFVYGIGEFFNKRPYKQYFLITGLSTLATLINPYGWKYWPFLIDAVSMSRPYVEEWNPINLMESNPNLFGFKIFAVMVLISYTYLFVKKIKEVNWAEIAVLLVTFYMSMKHMRHLVFFVIASASYIYYYFYPALSWMTFGIWEKFLSKIPEKLVKISYYSRDILVYTFIFFLTFGLLLFKQPKLAVNDKQYPVKAVEFIRENDIKGNLLVLFNWGSYALWKLYPQMKVSFDGRYEEVYTPEHVEDMARFQYAGTNWYGVLNKYKHDAILIPVDKDSRELFLKVKRLPDWKLVYIDDMGAVFVPNSNKTKVWKPISKKFNGEKVKYISGY